MPLFKRATPPPAEVTTFGAGGGGGWPPFPVGFLGQQSLDSWWQFVSQTIWTGDFQSDEVAALGVPAVGASLAFISAYVTQMPLEAVRENNTNDDPPEIIYPPPPVVANP